jgi:hypothetical protein
MTEHAYIRAVHRLLPPSTDAWKINDVFEGGVADAYYSGPAGDMWIEYKFVKALPKRPGTMVPIDLSELQKQWHRRRHAHGRRVAVVVGSPTGAVIFEGLTWEKSIRSEDFIRTAVAKRAVASYILSMTEGAGIHPR